MSRWKQRRMERGGRAEAGSEATKDTAEDLCREVVALSMFN